MNRPTLLVLLLLAACHKDVETSAPAAPEPATEPAAEAVETDSEASVAETEATTGTRVGASRTPGAARPEPGAADPDGTTASPGERSPRSPDAADPSVLPEDGEVDGAGEADERGPPKGLEVLSNNRWRVPRHLAERWEEHYNRVGRFRQVEDGWRIRVRENSPGWWLGMRTGDVILEVNGMKLNTKAQMLAAYVKLRNKEDFEVLIRRGGSNRVHKYSIVD